MFFICFGDLSKLAHRLRGLFESLPSTLNYSSLRCGHYRRPSTHQQTWGKMKPALDVKSCVPLIHSNGRSSRQMMKCGAEETRRGEETVELVKLHPEGLLEPAGVT